MGQSLSTLSIFDQLANICPTSNGKTSDVITVVLDERNPLGKLFTERQDGGIDKESVVAIGRGVACQYYVPDFATLEAVLRVVSDNTHAAITNAGWKHVALGEKFVFLSTTILAAKGLEREAITTDNGMKAFARLKDHATPSTWQLLDRDEDEFTPEWASKLAFDEWRLVLDKILPGLSKVKMLRAHSSSARVLKADGSAVGGGNGHVWIKVADAEDAERTRVAIMARALELDLAWTKPRTAKATGLECGRGWATIVDSSVWTIGRLVFAGRPRCSADLTIIAQQFQLINGEYDALDTSLAVVSVLKTFRASARRGAQLRLSRSGQGYKSVMHNLSLDTEIELEDGSATSVQDLRSSFTEKVRCQAPFRASTSMAAFLALDAKGEPFVFDSGTDTHHVLEGHVTTRDTDADGRRLIEEIRFRLGQLIGDENVDAVFNDATICAAWNSTYYQPTNGKITVLNRNDDLVDLTVADLTRFGFGRTFGRVYHYDCLEEVIAEKHLPEPDENKLRTTLAYLEHGPLTENLKLLKQAKSLDISVDMFATRGGMAVADNIATIVLPHRRFVAEAVVEASVVEKVAADYIKHFPEFFLFLALVLHARFATDRRHAFVWLHSPSSWGKGFLLAIFEALGLVVPVSASEIEKAMAGGPVGLSLADTLRSWILFVDEFKAASSELKLLNRQMSISPKNQLRCTVQLYTKLFASAENVRSLVGEGIEEQFNNRFAYLSSATNAEKLEDRPLFIELGKAVYIAALVKYVAEYLNDGIERLRALGNIESSKVSDTFIEEYQSERRLQTTFGSLDDAVDDIVAEIAVCLDSYAMWKLHGEPDSVPDAVKGIGPQLLATLRRTSSTGYVSVGDNSKQRKWAIVISNPQAFIKKYLTLSEDRSTIGKLQYKVDEIAAKLHQRPDACSSKVRIYDRNGKSGGGAELGERRGVVIFTSYEPTEKPVQDSIPRASLPSDYSKL